MITVYLAGPIAECTDEEVHAWRDGIKDEFTVEVASGAISFHDPSVRDFRGKEHDHFDEIVDRDLEEIDDSDVLLAHYWKTGTGTPMEIAYGYWMRSMTVIIVVPPDKPVSPWLEYHGLVVRSMEEALTQLRARLR